LWVGVASSSKIHACAYPQALRDLQARQRDVEAAAPLLRLQLDAFRGQLADLRISDGRYAELQALPPEGRTALDDVKASTFVGAGARGLDVGLWAYELVCVLVCICWVCLRG
jgi:hypothetical protein